MAKKKSDKSKKVYMLLDRTGSMQGMWEEAINSINLYLEKLDKDVDVYLACFDSEGFDVLREGRDVKKLDKDEVSPRAMTPLYDAAAKVMNHMLEQKPVRAVFVVMTDGMENASREHKLTEVRGLMDKLDKKKWPCVFLGSNFKDVDTYTAKTFRMDLANSIPLGKGQSLRGMSIMSTKTSAYFGGGGGGAGDDDAMAWTNAEKESVS
jgi:uncharacterized protein with von Willebrand factor type A (vWA) domain